MPKRTYKLGRLTSHSFISGHPEASDLVPKLDKKVTCANDATRIDKISFTYPTNFSNPPTTDTSHDLSIVYSQRGFLRIKLSFRKLNY